MCGIAVSLRVTPNFDESARRVEWQTTIKNTRWYYTPKRQQLLKRLINYLLSNCFFSLYFTCALFLLYFVQLDIRAQLLKGTLDKQCNTTKLLTWICPFCIIHTVFRDFRNPGSNQKFLSLVVFLEGFYPYFRLVPVQNNFRLQLSLKRNYTISSLFDVFVCSIAEYLYELRRILTSAEGESKYKQRMNSVILQTKTVGAPENV